METASEWGSNTCTVQTASETETHFDIITLDKTTYIQIKHEYSVSLKHIKRNKTLKNTYKIKKKMFTSGFEPTFSSLLFTKVSL